MEIRQMLTFVIFKMLFLSRLCRMILPLSRPIKFCLYDASVRCLFACGTQKVYTTALKYFIYVLKFIVLQQNIINLRILCFASYVIISMEIKYIITSTMVMQFTKIVSLLKKKVSAVKQSISISFVSCCNSHSREPRYYVTVSFFDIFSPFKRLL